MWILGYDISCRTLVYLARLYLTLPHPTVPCRTLPHRTIPFYTVPIPTVHHPTLQYRTLDRTVWHSTRPYPTLPYRSLPHRTLPVGHRQSRKSPLCSWRWSKSSRVRKAGKSSRTERMSLPPSPADTSQKWKLKIEKKKKITYWWHATWLRNLPFLYIFVEGVRTINRAESHVLFDKYVTCTLPSSMAETILDNICFKKEKLGVRGWVGRWVGGWVCERVNRLI